VVVVRSAGEMFLGLFPVVSPFVSVPTFVALTADSERERRLREARQTALIVGALLAVFLVVGEPLLHHLGISLAAIEIAGGILVGYTGFVMVLEPAPPPPDPNEPHESIAFVPMTMPLLAGPGAIGMVMSIESTSSRFLSAIGDLVGVVAMALAIYVILVASEPLLRFLGRSGIDALNRLSGLFALAIGVELVILGILHHPHLHHPG
jgi:MarC family membrane protein